MHVTFRVVSSNITEFSILNLREREGKMFFFVIRAVVFQGKSLIKLKTIGLNLLNVSVLSNT